MRTPFDRLRVVRYLTMTVVLLLVVAACSRGARPPDDSVLVIGQQQEPISLNPALENGQRSTQWGELLFSYLVKYDDKGRLIGDVAQEVPTLRNGGISKDGLTITYHLRRGVRFADGVPLTASDCVWSINAINNTANNVQTRYGYDRVARAEAPNPYTLVLHLKQPFAPILSLVLAPQGFPILPRHLLAKYPNFNNIDFDTQPIGSGPYVVERWLHGDRVEMRANPGYFLGEPRIPRMVVKFIPRPEQGTNELRTGEIQAYFNEQDYGQYPALTELPRYHVHNTPVSAVDALIFNTQSPGARDPLVRRALAEAIDFHSLVAKAYRGALDSHAAGRGLFLWAYDAGAYPDVPYNPAFARSVLQSRNLHLQLIIQAGVPAEEVAANDIAQYEKSAGASVTIKKFNVTQFGAPADLGGPVYGGKFDMALYSFVNGDDPDTTDQFACSHVPPAGYNKSRICDPRIDVLLRAGLLTYDLDARKAIYARLQAQLYRDLPIALIYQRRELDAFTDRLFGPNGSVDSVFWNVAAWRFAPRLRSGSFDTSR